MEKGLLAVGLMMLLGATMYLNTTEVSDEIDMAKLYASWKLKYNKRYTNQKDEMYRFKIFTDNVNMIKAFYESPEEQTYTLEINQFSDLTSEEFARTYLNLQVPKKAYNKNVEANYNPLGDSIDWVAAGKVPAVKNQGQCGSCWAFSAVGTLEINAKIELGETYNLSEQDLVDCSGVYGNQGCNGGWMDSAYEYVMDNGLALGSDYPYTARDGTCKSVKRPFTNVISYVDIDTCAELRESVFERSIAVAVDATNWSSYASGVFTNCKANLNHGVVLVGVEESGVWKIRNSWGASWGDKGYIRLAAGNTCGICLAPSFPVLE